MPQANANRQALYTVPESTWGTPVTGTQRRTMRYTGESLAHNKNTVDSKELRADGNVPDLIEVGVEAGGNINFELSPGSYTLELENLLRSTFVTTTFGPASVVFNSGAKTMAATNIGVGLVVGQIIRVVGTLNVGFFTLTVVTTNSVTVSETVATETVSATINGSYIRNAMVEKFHTIEREFGDLSSGHFQQFPGSEVNTMDLNVQADSVVNGVWGMLCKEELTPTSATFSAAGAPSAATTTDVLNATSSVGTVLEGSTLAALTTAIQGITLNVNTNRAGRRAIKNRGAVGIRQGRCVVTGTMTAYFEDAALLTKMIAHTASGLQCRLHTNPSTPTVGPTVIVTIPRLKYSGGDPNATAVDTDVLLPLAFQGLYNSGTGCTIQIDVFT